MNKSFTVATIIAVTNGDLTSYENTNSTPTTSTIPVVKEIRQPVKKSIASSDDVKSAGRRQSARWRGALDILATL